MASHRLEIPDMSIDPSKRCFRIWKALTITVAAYVVVMSSYLFGFVPAVSQLHNSVDLLTCMLFIIDIGVTFFATSYIDNKTNTYVRGSVQRLTIFFGSWGPIRILGVIPVLLLPRHVIKFWYITRIVHVREVFKAVSYLKMEQHTKVNASIKWFRILFVILFSIHFMGCIFYFIGNTNPSHNPLTWTSLGKEQMKNEKYKGLFKYLISIYWSTTVFTTVGYGDYHAVNGLEMAFNVISMLFYMLLNSYVSSIMSELLQATHQSAQFSEDSDALRNFIITHHLQDELHQEMYKFLVKTRDNQIAKSFDIQRLFPKYIQFQVKSALSGKMAETYLFRGVSQAFSRLLVAEMELVTFEAHEVFLLVNDYPKKLYILVEGSIEGVGLTNHALRIGGEFGVICGLPQPYNVRANQKSTLFCLSQKKFHELMQVNRRDELKIVSNTFENLASQRGDGGDGDPIIGSIYSTVMDKFFQAETNLHLDIPFVCRWGFPKLLLKLIKSGEDVDENYREGKNILHIVVDEGRANHELLVRILLREMSDTTINQKDDSGRTPLCYAIDKNRESLIDLFHQRNVRLADDEVNRYYARIMVCDDSGLLEIIHKLEASVDILDPFGQTPLHLAVLQNRATIVRMLLDWGANQNLVDSNGFTPLQLAVNRGYSDIQALLEA